MEQPTTGIVEMYDLINYKKTIECEDIKKMVQAKIDEVRESFPDDYYEILKSL